MQRAEVEHVAAFGKFQRDLIAQMVKRYGIPQGGLPESLQDIPEEVQEAHPLPPQPQPSKPVDPKPIGQWLRVAREGKKMTQPQLAKALSTSPATISRLESSGEGPQIITALQLVDPTLFSAELPLPLQTEPRVLSALCEARLRATEQLAA